MIGGRFLSYHHSNAQFKMPNDPNVPVLMISAGSGIAPFRAFWQQRMLRHYPKTSAWLYFGCRDVTENMFSDETQKFVQRRVAFSRIDKNRKEYVQDLIEQDCAQVYDLIANHQAHLYICGKVNTVASRNSGFVRQRQIVHYNERIHYYGRNTC